MHLFSSNVVHLINNNQHSGWGPLKRSNRGIFTTIWSWVVEKIHFDAHIFYQQKQKGAEQRGSYIWALPRTVRVPPSKKPAFLVRNFFIYFLFWHSCRGQSPSQTHSAKLFACFPPQDTSAMAKRRGRNSRGIGKESNDKDKEKSKDQSGSLKQA